MKTLAITVANKQQEQLFFDLAEQLGIEISIASFKPLTHKEVALGTSGAVLQEQLEEYVVRNRDGKPKSAARVKESLSKRLSK